MNKTKNDTSMAVKIEDLLHTNRLSDCRRCDIEDFMCLSVKILAIVSSNRHYLFFRAI